MFIVKVPSLFVVANVGAPNPWLCIKTCNPESPLVPSVTVPEIVLFAVAKVKVSVFVLELKDTPGGVLKPAVMTGVVSTAETLRSIGGGGTPGSCLGDRKSVV